MAGVHVPQGQSLPEPLALRQQAIESVIADWLEPFELSKDICRAVTPNLLRLLPRLLHRVAEIKAIETKQKNTYRIPAQYNVFSEEDKQAFQNILLVIRTQDRSLAKEMQEKKEAVLQRLHTYPIPRKLLLLVQASFAQQTLANKLMDSYLALPKVADYLAAEVKADFEACSAFHKRLFQHYWQTPCEVPATQSMQQYTKAFRP